jgi:hypothetical protein
VIFAAGGQFLSLAHCFILFVAGVAEQGRTNKKVQHIIKLARCVVVLRRQVPGVRIPSGAPKNHLAM